ncbi:Ig-like domain repeat protein [Candidatus Pacearchaeota archaeon]|nr:Ig-like domain repeat protein [Candidatus Pacearchaeota archaeon]
MRKNNFLLIFYILLIVFSINSVYSVVLLSDDFEDGDLAGWSITTQAGANAWSNSNTDPQSGTRHANAQPQSTTEPATVMEDTLSTVGYNNISITYYRKLISIDAADEFEVEYNYGAGWTILEETGGGTADDSSYVFKNFSLPGSASNNSNLQFKIECTAGAVSEHCRVDNFVIYGEEIPASDSTPPNVTINSPSNQSYATTSFIFNVTAVDNLGMTNCSYSLNNGATNYSMKNLTTSPNQWNASNSTVNQGSATVRFYCYDINSNLNNSESITFFVDSITPTATIVTPANRTNSTNINLNINYTRNDTNLGSCWYSNDTYSVNRSLGNVVACGNLTNITWSEGLHNVTIYSNDSVGNLAFSSVTFTIDSVNPGINFSSGTLLSGVNQSSTSIFVNVSVTEINEQAIVFNLFFTNGTLVNKSQFTNPQRTINWTNLIDEDYHFNVTVNDTFGNSNVTQTRSVTIDTLNPEINYTPSSTISGNQSLTQIFVNVSVTELNEQAIVFRLFYSNGSLINTSTFLNKQRTLNFTGLEDGTYVVNVSVNDSAGNKNVTETRSFSIDTTSPSASFASPSETNGTRVRQDFIEINVSANDSGSGLQAIAIRLFNSSHGEINSSLSVSSPLYVNFSGLSDGIYFFNATINDSLNNVFLLGSITVTLDLTKPRVSIDFPGNRSYSQSSIMINTSLNEEGSCLYSLTSGLFNYSMTANSSSTGFSATNTSINDGSFRVYAYCNDSVGNENHTENKDFVIDTTVPSISYNEEISDSGNQSAASIFVNVSVTETNEQTIVFSLFYTNGTLVNRSQFSAGTRTINWTGLNDEDYHFNVTVNDSAGNKNTSIRLTVTVDSTKPRVPMNNSNSSSNSLDVNFTRSDPNLGSCWYSNDSLSVNVSLSNCNNITSVIWSEGSHTVVIYVNDSAGNENETRISFTIDSTLPTVTIIHPSNGSTRGTNQSLSLNFSISENNLLNCWYSVNGGTNISLPACVNSTFNVSGDGNHQVIVYVNDSVGQVGQTTVSFTVTIGAPTIILHSPVNSFVNSSSVVFNYTPSDPELARCELWGNFDGTFKLNQTNLNSTNNAINSFLLNLTDGTYLWNIRCNDSFGNDAFDGNKTFYVDTIKPSISLTEPTGTKTNRSNISLTYSTNDTWNISCVYNVYRGVNVEIANTSVDCHANSTTFNVTINADFILNFYVNDSAGNVNSSSISFTVSTSSDSGSGGGSGGGGGGGGGGISGGSGGGGSVVKKAARFNASEIGEIISYPGDKKTLSVELKNTGTVFLNNCRLIFSGNISSWIYSDEIKGIAPGENALFIFDVNVPEGIDENKYEGFLEMKCDEYSEIQGIEITIPSSAKNIHIKEIKQHKKNLNVSYDFDYTPVAGNDVSIDIWLVDQDGKEVLRETDTFSVVKDERKVRKVNLKLPKDMVGVYTIYLALSSEPESFVKQTVVIGKSAGLGLVIFGDDRAKAISYIIFVLVILVGIVWILRSVMLAKTQPKTTIKKGMFH